MLTVKTIKTDMAVGDALSVHLMRKCPDGRLWRVKHRYYTTAAYVYGVGEPHYPVPALQYQHRIPWWLFDDGLIVLP